MHDGRPVTRSARAGVRVCVSSSFVALILSVQPALAERRLFRSDAGDSYEIQAESRTYLQLYQRALVPGALGALIGTDELAPLHAYVGIRVRGLDLPSRKDAVDIELSGWGRYDLADLERAERLDGDLTAANVRVGFEHFSVKAGRQLASGGAARYVRFDGLKLATELWREFGVETYAGFSVVTPTFRRRGYLLLGAASDSLRSALPFEEEPRHQSWIAGGRLQYRAGPDYGAAASFHHQEEGGELERSHVALEAHGLLDPSVDCAGFAALDVDARRISDARLFCDVFPKAQLDLTAELLHTEPALFLSRQSVLSVFSTSGFDELGGRATYRVSRSLSLEANAYLNHHDGGEFGSKGELSVELKPEGSGRILIWVGYARLVGPGNGYHRVRAALRRRLYRTLVGTLESHFYAYDEAILGYESSSVYAGTLSSPLGAGFGVLVSGSVSRSPHAQLDAQSLIRVSYDFSRVER